MRKCHEEVERTARVIVGCLVLAVILLSCFSKSANASEVQIELGLTAVSGKLDESYLGAGYRATNGLGVGALTWKYVEPTIYNSQYPIYADDCDPVTILTGRDTCEIIGYGYTPLPSTATRQMVAGVVDYQLRYGPLAIAAGAAYLSRETDRNDRVELALAVTLRPAKSPCGLSLRKIGGFGFVGAQCGF